MDPNEALAEMRLLLRDYRAGVCYGPGGSGTLGQVADRVEALDEWLCHGGFAPEDWRPLMFPQTEREAWAETIAEHGLLSACATCGQDIERHGDTWRDRGGNTACGPSGRYDRDGHPIPVPEGTTHTPYRATDPPA